MKLAFGTLERTKFVTAASELARNTLVHGKGGTVTITEVERDGRTGIKLVFADEGPGIPDIERALEDGYSTAKSMGLGLGVCAADRNWDGERLTSNAYV
ncbi:ATP-binding protein [Burkholderia sp. PAMC 28687]|uniref:ATP-binding protein n=1 Tax=Burkholderia sp. PAMC 28687 TaxID=1795874 RepID=UPI002FFAABEF